MTRRDIVFSMCDFAKKFIRKYKNPNLDQDLIDAIIVDYINYFVAMELGMIFTFYTEDLRDGKKLSEEEVVIPKQNMLYYLNYQKKAYDDFGIMESVNQNSYTNKCHGNARADNSEILKVIEAFINSYVADN